MAEEVGKRPRLGDELAEGIVCVRRNDATVRIDILRDVAVVVIARNVDDTINCLIQETSNATRSLQRTGKVFAPIIFRRRYHAARICIASICLSQSHIIIYQNIFL